MGGVVKKIVNPVSSTKLATDPTGLIRDPKDITEDPLTLFVPGEADPFKLETGQSTARLAKDLIGTDIIGEPNVVEEVGTVDVDARLAESKRLADQEKLKEQQRIRRGVSRSTNILTSALGLLSNQPQGAAGNNNLLG